MSIFLILEERITKVKKRRQKRSKSQNDRQEGWDPPKEYRGREPLKKWKSRRNPMLPLWKIQPRPTENTMTAKKAKIQKKVYCPEGWDPPKECRDRESPKKCQDRPKGCTSQKGRIPHAPSFKDSTKLTITAMSQEGQDPKKGYCPEGWDLRKECRGQ